MGKELATATMDGLSDAQRLYVEALLDGASEAEAKAKAGYSHNTVTQSIVRGPLMERIIQSYCDAQIKGPLRLKALKAIEKLIDEGPHATRLNAAKLVLEYGKDDEKGDDRPITERSTAELEAMVEALEAERAGRAKDVTPKIGA